MRKNGDEASGTLLARIYFRMLGQLSELQMSQLTEMVLDRFKWFPTVAECRELMAEQSYANPFYARRRQDQLTREGYALENPLVRSIAAHEVKLIGSDDGPEESECAEASSIS